MNKGGRWDYSVKPQKKMSGHVVAYYTHLMNSVDTGCKLTDYCTKDVYAPLILSNWQ